MANVESEFHEMANAPHTAFLVFNKRYGWLKEETRPLSRDLYVYLRAKLEELIAAQKR